MMNWAEAVWAMAANATAASSVVIFFISELFEVVKLFKGALFILTAIKGLKKSRASVLRTDNLLTSPSADGEPLQQPPHILMPEKKRPYQKFLLIRPRSPESMLQVISPSCCPFHPHGRSGRECRNRSLRMMTELSRDCRRCRGSGCLHRRRRGSGTVPGRKEI